jgi:hypothetical protein
VLGVGLELLVVGDGDGVVAVGLGLGEDVGDPVGEGAPVGEDDGLGSGFDTSMHPLSQFLAFVDSPVVPAALRS